MKVDYKNLLASELEEVILVLEKNNNSVHTNETSPPGNKSGNGIKRVIKIDETDISEITILWSYENYN